MEGDDRASAPFLIRRYFYPRPPGGGRLPALPFHVSKDSNFYPRPPGGGRPVTFSIFRVAPSYFYPRPPGGGRREYCGKPYTEDDFYPRPPGGGRPFEVYVKAGTAEISIHALRVEGDSHTRRRRSAPNPFLSTPSGWRATSGARALPLRLFYFYPRPPGGGRHSTGCPFFHPTFYFYPRPPGGGRPCEQLDRTCYMMISIHALRVEGDWRFIAI